MVCKGDGYSNTKAFSYISQVSNEKEKQISLILESIKDIKKNNYLDIGAGAGDILISISEHFKNSFGIEPGKKMFLLLKKKSNKDIKLYNCSWEEFYKKNKDKQKYDLITLVHTIYFFKDIKKEINKMYSLLNKNGKLIIICGSVKKVNKRDLKHRFTTYFRHKLLNNSLDKKEYSDIDKWYKNIKCKRFKCFLKLKNLDYLDKNHLTKDCEATNNFFKFIFKRWWDEYTVKEKKDFKNYLKPYLTKDKQYYIVPNYDQRIYIIKK